jgi:hypothetical protein
MSSDREDGRRGETSVVALAPRRTSATGVRAKSRMGRRPKGKAYIRAVEPTDRLDSGRPLITRQRKGFETTENSERSGPEKIESLERYIPGGKKYEVSLTFSGEAGAKIGELMTKLDVDTPNEVVKLTIALLLSAQGKEILFRDPETGVVEVVDV